MDWIPHDLLLDDFMRENGFSGKTYIYRPYLFDHIGRKTSRPDDANRGMSTPPEFLNLPSNKRTDFG